MTTTTCRVCGGQTNAFLCRACAGDITRALKTTTSLMHELSLLATHQTRVQRANGKARPDTEYADLEEEHAWRVALLPPHLRTREGRITLPASPAMVNEMARELLTELSNTVVTWARHIAETRGSDISADRVSTVVTWLLDHVDAIRFDEAGPEFHGELLDVHHRAVRAVDRTSSRFYAGPCHAPVTEGKRCQRSLYALPDADEIECDGWAPWTPGQDDADVGCGAVHTAFERDAWLVRELEDALLPLTLWQDALPKRMKHLTWPTRSTWWKWARPNASGRRLLEPRTVIDGVEFYRGGDIMSLVDRSQGRIRGNIRGYAGRTA